MRVYAQDYQSEIILDRITVVQMHLDSDGKPYVDIEPRLEAELLRLLEEKRAASMQAQIESGALNENQQFQEIGSVAPEEPLIDPNADPLGILAAWKSGDESDPSIQAMTANAAREYVGSLGNDEHLKALRKGEETHAIFENGRKGVLAAIDARLIALEHGHG